MNNEKTQKKPHSLTLLDRSKLSLTGVEKVIGASSTQVAVHTTQGGLTIVGSDLKIEKYDVNDGCFALSGKIDALKYGEKKNVWGKLFR